MREKAIIPEIPIIPIIPKLILEKPIILIMMIQ